MDELGQEEAALVETLSSNERQVLYKEINGRVNTEMDYKLSVDEAKFIALYFIDQIDYEDKYFKNKVLPWQEVSFKSIQNKLGNISSIEQATSWEEIYDMSGDELVFQDFAKSFGEMAPQDRIQVSQFMADNLADFEQYFVADEQDRFVYLMLAGLDSNVPGFNDLAETLIKYVADARRDKKRYSGGNARYVVDEVLFFGNQRLVVEGIARLEKTSDVKIVINEMVANRGLSYVLEAVRDNMLSGSQESSKKLLLYLMGVGGTENASVDASINDFFNAIDFIEKYLVEKDKRPQTLSETIGVLAESEVLDRSNVLVLGSAGGWLVGGLQSSFNVWGIDINQDFIDRARERYGGRFMRINWNNLKKELQSNRGEALLSQAPKTYKAVVSRGRDIRHVPGENELQNLFDQVSAILEEEGVFTFDLTDPETGYQRDQHEAYHEFLTGFYFDRDWLDKFFWHRIGAPLGQDGQEHYIETYDPPQFLVEALLNVSGFEVIGVVAENNYDGRGSVNLVYTAKKVHEDKRDGVRNKGRTVLNEYERQKHAHPGFPFKRFEFSLI